MCGSDSIFLIAFSTEGTGPRTTDPTFSSPSCRFMAIRYSSSTTRMRRSRSAELAILHLLSLRSGERKRDCAVDAVRFDRKSCPGSELIGQRVLDEPPPASVALASSRHSRRVDASLSLQPVANSARRAQTDAPRGRTRRQLCWAARGSPALRDECPPPSAREIAPAYVGTMARG